jgi:hypothetical protein
MRQDWIIDVLADLRSFAAKNGMTGLKHQLDDTLIIAAADIDARAAGPRNASNDEPSIGNLHRAGLGSHHL